MTLKPYLHQQKSSCLDCVPSFLPFWFTSKNHLTRSGSYNDPRGWAIFDPRGKTGRIYVKLHMTMLYIKYTSFVSCCCREDFFIYFHYKSMVDNDMPGAWPVWTPGAPLAAFIKESIIHWSTQHMKALGHMVSEKKIFFYVFPMTPPGRGPYKQNRKALGLVVSEKKIFLCFTHDPPPPPPPPPPGAGPYGTQGHGWQEL